MGISAVDLPAPSAEYDNGELDVARRPTLSQLRKRQLLSATELAERSGVGLSTIRDIEVRGRRPRLATIRRLCEALGVAPDAVDWPGNPLELDPDEDGQP